MYTALVLQFGGQNSTSRMYQTLHRCGNRNVAAVTFD